MYTHTDRELRHIQSDSNDNALDAIRTLFPDARLPGVLLTVDAELPIGGD